MAFTHGAWVARGHLRQQLAELGRMLAQPTAGSGLWIIID
jgi:hypothetical protein